MCFFLLTQTLHRPPPRPIVGKECSGGDAPYRHFWGTQTTLCGRKRRKGEHTCLHMGFLALLPWGSTSHGCISHITRRYFGHILVHLLVCFTAIGSPGQKVVERPNRFYLFFSFLTGDWLNWSKEEEEGERVARNSLKRRPKSPPDLCTSVNETSSNGCIDPPPPPLLLRIQFFEEEGRDGFQGNVWGGRTYAPTFFLGRRRREFGG